jgi:hypothetical protein
MRFNTLEKKQRSADNTKMILSMPTVIFADNTEVMAVHTVTEDQVCRIDLISLKYYRDADYCDYILKWNGISNPFSIDEGDVLEIPMNISVLRTIKPIRLVGPANQISIRDQFVDTKRLPVKDAKRIEYLQRKAAQKANGSKQILPPNILKEGDSNITIGNGFITI